MSKEENGLPTKTKPISENCEMVSLASDWNNKESTSKLSDDDDNFTGNFSNVIVDGLVESGNNNLESSSISNTNSHKLDSIAPVIFQEPSSQNPIAVSIHETNQNSANLVVNITADISRSSLTSGKSYNTSFIKQASQQNNYFTVESLLSLQPSRNCYSSLEGTSLESGCSTVSFVTEIEITSPRKPHLLNKNENLLSELSNEQISIEMEESAESSEKTSTDPSSGNEEGSSKPTSSATSDKKEKDGTEIDKGEHDEGAASADNDEEPGQEESDEEEDTTTLSSEAVVDDIELILMPEMCQDLSQPNVSPKLVRVTELKVNVDDVFCDEDDEDQSSRHEFRSIVDEVCEEENDRTINLQGRHSVEDDEVSSGSELIGIGAKKGAINVNEYVGESSSKSSSSSGRRRRSTSGRINSGVQTEITALEEPSAVSSSHHGFRKKASGKSASARLGIPSSSSGGTGGKKLNWKSELTLLPSKMKVKQTGFNSFESNDERDQYSPRVAKFTSQDTLNLSSQFLKPSTLYRTRNLSRNLNQFASSESTFMLPMSSSQLSGESPRFRDRVSSSTSGGGVGNFKGTTPLHSYSAYQISSILSGGGSGTVSGIGMGFASGFYGSGTNPISSARRQPSISGGCMNLSGSSSRHFRSSMPDLNAVNKSYAAAAASMADSHRRRQHPKSLKHHHSSSGFRLQKRSSSDEETSSLIDESERCLRSSIDLLLTDELPSPGGDYCFRSSGLGSSSFGNLGLYSSRRSCSQPILNDQAYPPEMRDPSMGSPFLPRKLSDMRCSRWAKVILPNGHVAVVSVKEIDEIQDTLAVHTDSGCVINIPFRKVVFAWKTKR